MKKYFICYKIILENGYESTRTAQLNIETITEQSMIDVADKLLSIEPCVDVEILSWSKFDA